MGLHYVFSVLVHENTDATSLRAGKRPTVRSCNAQADSIATPQVAGKDAICIFSLKPDYSPGSTIVLGEGCPSQ